MNLKVLRTMRGYTQFDLTLKTGIRQSRISLMENGYIEPKRDEHQKIAKVLGVNGKDLEFGRMGQNESLGER
ncbi:MAG: helix-turn-helix transcriptional regulator [Desulfobacteraceae bacterium]|nr:helix-turn-helix transcriptional regulator [Desulfobacteraceae bacterium]MBL7217397.1 helix-turn-helix transcriptional regulator [Desulfobacteraceae bacterium]